MIRVKNRSIAVVILALALLAGLGIYVVKLTVSGGKWASSRINQAAYSGNALVLGTVTDRNGEVLAAIENGARVFATDKKLRTATLHTVGDREGNIGTGALRTKTAGLIGYDFLSGMYSLDGRGGTVELSLDSRLNIAAYDALAGRSGAVVVLDYKTGETLCLVSAPSFDPDNAGEVNIDDPRFGGVYLNRAISSSYTPGSVFKLVTMAAALENISDIGTRVFSCTGALSVGEGAVTCPSRHGDIGFYDALAHSCNIAFAELALELGAEALGGYAERYGLIAPLEIDETLTAKGNFAAYDDGSFELAWSGAGQGANLCSPMAMARFAAAIANGGAAPQLTFEKRSFSLTAKTERIMNAVTAAQLLEMMAYNVEDRYGTENYPGLELRAKSGTAEVGGTAAPHAWFVGFIENEGHPLAFAVIVENGGSGRAVAGEVANKVLQEAVK